MPGAQPIWGRVHPQPSVPHGRTQRGTTEAESDARQPALQRLVSTRAQRTVRRRLARLQARAAAWEMPPWGSTVEAKRPQLLWSVGRGRLPATSNALARFCRACQRVDCPRGGVHAVLRAKRALRLLLVVSVFTPHATTGQAPIAVLVPEARSMPLYRLSNAPFRALQERAEVKPEAPMADVLRPQAAAA